MNRIASSILFASFRTSARICLAAVALTLLSVHEAYADYILRSRYTFDGNYQDSLNRHPDLVPVKLSPSAANPVLSGGSTTFDGNQGLMLTTSLTASSFRLEMDVQLQTIGRWFKLMDFSELSGEHGLYVNSSRRLEFYGRGPAGSLSLNAGQTYTVGLQRQNNSVSFDLNGVTQWTFNQPAAVQATNNRIYLFIDDLAGGNESFIGSTSEVRLYAAAPVPEPSQIAQIMLCAGLMSAWYRLKRRRPSAGGWGVRSSTLATQH